MEKITIHQTDGGIPVISERTPYFRSAAISVNVLVGSRDEDKEKCGIAHLLEHIMFKGTKDQSAKQIADMIEGAGGELNGFTTKELTSYHVFSLDETIDVAEGLLTDMMLHALIDDEHVDLEKSVVTQEISMLEDEPEEFAGVLLDRTAWRGHPMSYPEAGNIEGVRSITPDDLRAFYERHYRRPNVFIVACGNIDVGQVNRWASMSFDGIPRSKDVRKRTPPRFHSSINVFPKEGEQVYVDMGFPSYAASHENRHAASLAAIILGAGTSSRLYQRIREEEGLVYQIHMFPQTYSDCGLIETYFSSSVENAEKVVNLFAEEIREFKTEGLNRGELERAKRWVKGMFVRKLESSENRMYWLAESYTLTGKVKTITEMIEEFNKVTEEAVLQAADDLMKVSKFCVALHGPEKECKQLAMKMKGMDF
ncbi:MAG: insulinase family protein [Methanomassiliicoccales archaeon]|nr:MAG: insulinase family protein [Methanomassiliicoccales archaeon]